MTARSPSIDDVNGAALAPDRDMMLKHLLKLFGDQTEGLVELAWTPVYSNQVTSANLYRLDRLEDLVERAADLNAREGHNVYFGAALRHPNTAPFGRTKDEDVLLSASYWADLDEPGCAEAAEARCGTALPTFAVTTGKHPHLRQQIYWLQEAPVDLAKLEAQNAAIATQLQADPSIKNIGRVLRLAGSIAWPKKEGRIPELTELITYDDRPAMYINGAVAAAFPVVETVTSATNGADHDLNTADRKPRDLKELADMLGAARPGQWHDPVRDVVASLVGRGYSDDQIRLICAAKCDAGFNDPDLDKLIQTARKTFKMPSPEGSLATTQVEKPLIATPLGILDPSKIPLRRWLLGTSLIRGHVKLLVATGGAGKTQLTIQRAISIVTGLNLSGGKVHERGRAWLINGEDPVEELDRRIAAVCQQWGIDPEELREDLFRDSGFDRRLIVAKEVNGELVATPDVEALIEEIHRKQIDYLCIDPFVKAHRVSENANEAVDFVVEQFARIAAETNCAPELVHHTRKPPTAGSEGLAGNADSARGATALVNAARIVETLYPMTPKEAERLNIAEAERHLYLRVDAAKANMALIKNSATWFRRQEVCLPNGPDPAGVTGDRVGVLDLVELADPEERHREEQAQQRKEIAEKVAMVLEVGDRLSVNKVAARLIKQDLVDKSQSTTRRYIEDAIPTTPSSITIDLRDISTRLYKTQQGAGSTDPVLIVRRDVE